jgi:hypothetical protein
MRTSVHLAFAIAAGLLAAPLGAQSIFDASVRSGPQFVRYEIREPVSQTISEFALPIFVVVPISRAFNVDVGTSYTSARVENNGGAGGTSTISGLTDTQIRANLNLGVDFVVLTAGVNLPTGRSTASPEEQLAALQMGNDFLALPISNMGTGFGATAGLAVARPLGEWNVGFGASLRRSSAYEPFEDNAGGRPRFQPGNEYRARLGVDHAFGTGRFALGMIYSRFADDELAGSLYNTGDRYITQLGFNNSIGPADLVVAGWNLFRSQGTIFTGGTSARENIANVLIGVGFHTMRGVVEPTFEVRNLQTAHAKPSTLGNLGLRYSVDMGSFAITPSAAYTVGKFATSVGAADMTGFRAMLAIRLGVQ